MGPVIGYPDFSPDGNQIVVTIYGDLWLLHLNDNRTLASSEPLTRTVGDTEIQAAFSPDGSKIAYIAGPNSRFRRDIQPRLSGNLNIFTLNVGTHEVTKVTTGKNSLVDTQSPAWSPDGQFLAFIAMQWCCELRRL